MSVVTDPAIEIVDLCRFLSGINANKTNERAIEVLLREFGPDQSDTYFLIRKIRQRFTDFSESLRGIEDPLLDAQIIQLAKQASLRFITFTDLQQLQNPWANVSKLVSEPQNWAGVLAVSSTYRRLQPISKLDEATILEIKDYVSSDEIIERVKASNAPPFLSKMLLEAVCNLRMMLKFVPIFGHKELADLSADLEWKNEAVAYYDTEYGQSSWYKKLAKVAMVLASIYVIPPELVEASDQYKKWWLEVLPNFQEAKKNEDGLTNADPTADSALVDTDKIQQILDSRGRISGS